MGLEVIHRLPAERRHRTPILLVHGAWHGAWCWDDGFMERLADAGFEVHALSLRGHAGSPGRERLRRHTIADYVADVAQVAESLPIPPMVVGHSMGGWVVQKYLEQHEAPAAVLLASCPTSGTKGFTLRAAREYPMRVLRFTATMSAWPVVETPELTKHWFFSDSVPDDVIARHHERIQDESFAAAMGMMLGRVRPSLVTAPLLVLAAENDAIFTVKEEASTARAYGVELEVFPGMAHNLMSDPGWEAVADRIAAWAAETVA